MADINLMAVCGCSWRKVTSDTVSSGVVLAEARRHSGVEGHVVTLQGEVRPSAEELLKTKPGRGLSEVKYG